MQTKYPIVLVHGMVAKDFFFWHAFRGIAGFLKAQGLTVYVTNQDGVGSVASNAAQLKEELLAIIKKSDCDKVNIIAHSKGGVDARHMISCLDMGSHVASLTTLSTPHHGSGLSARLLKMPRFMAKTIAFFTNLSFRILGDKEPDIMQLGRDLTPEAMASFNQTVHNAPEVYYQSFASTAGNKKDFLSYIPYQISRYCEKDDNDGMVSVSSSQWGNYRGTWNKPMNHFKMVGLYGTKKRLADVGIFYLNLILELQEMGY